MKINEFASAYRNVSRREVRRPNVKGRSLSRSDQSKRDQRYERLDRSKCSAKTLLWSLTVTVAVEQVTAGVVTAGRLTYG